MAAAGATELARNAISHSVLLRTEFELFRDQCADLSLPELRERVAVLETQVVDLRREAESATRLRHAHAVLEEKVTRLEKVAEEAKQLPVILDRLNKLEDEKRESYKRVWQFFFLLAGVVLGVVGNLIAGSLRQNGGPSK